MGVLCGLILWTAPCRPRKSSREKAFQVISRCRVGWSSVATILDNPLDPADGVPAGSTAYFVYDKFDNLRTMGGDQVGQAASPGW